MNGDLEKDQGNEQDFLEEEEWVDEGEDEEEDDEDKPEGEYAEWALGRFTTDLVEEALEGNLDPLVGREDEMRSVIRILSRRKKNNPLLVGEPGVGKTAIVDGLASAIARGDVPDSLKLVRIRSLDVGSLLAGTRFRGDFEKRLKAVSEAISERNEIMFVDECHTIIGAGSTMGAGVDAANMLKPVLASGKLKCIAATTHDEYGRYIAKDRAFMRRFQMVDIQEPPRADAVKMLWGIKDKYAKHHGVVYEDAAVMSAVNLSIRHIRDRHLPDKAIDVLDETGADVVMSRGHGSVVTSRDVECVVAKMAGVPVGRVSARDEDILASLERKLGAKVFGQEEAIRQVAEVVKLARLGVRDESKPMGCILLVGPPSVGKTELARSVASVLGIEFLRFDMSEYAEPHTVSQLIGAAPGYVGYEEGGRLTEAVRRTPNSVVLLDEIDKAHARVYDVLLQVMDYGTLTDASGQMVDFRSAFLVMTSNSEETRGAFGFASKGMEIKEAARFSREFKDRLDATVFLRPLGEDVMMRLADKFITQHCKQLRCRGVRVSITKAAREWLTTKCHESGDGARGLDKLIRAEVCGKIVDEMLRGRLRNGGDVRFGVKGGELKYVLRERCAIA